MIETLSVVLPLMLSPGPANLVSFALAARYGFIQILSFLLGISLVYTLFAILFGYITLHIIEYSSNIPVILKLLGGVFIFYLGVQLIRRKDNKALTKAPTFSNGVLLQILNPKYPPVVLSVFAHNQSQHGLLTASIISTVGVIGLIIYAITGTLIHSRINSEKSFGILDLAFGTLLCIVGLWFFIEPINAYIFSKPT